MKNKIEVSIGMSLSDPFKKLIQKFEKHFGGHEDAYPEYPLEKFCEYLSIGWLANKDAVRNYDLVPFEAELPFPTGIDGNHKGWLNLCPEIANFKKPFILWTAVALEVWYCGMEEIEIMQNVIRHGYKDNFQSLDLSFLESIGINPERGKDYKFISSELANGPSKIPVTIPTGYKYEMTVDGVGVIAKEDYFSQTDSHISRKLSQEKYMELAEQYQRQQLYGSSLFYLKEAYFRLFYHPGSLPLRLRILNMKKELYLALGRFEIASLINKEIEKIKLTKN